MPIPPGLRASLTLPVIAAPMFLVSGCAGHHKPAAPPALAARSPGPSSTARRHHRPELVINTCKAGVIGTFPALNARTDDILDTWLGEITTALAEYKRQQPAAPVAPFGVNLIVHKTNPRLQENLAKVVKHKVPVVITSLGAVKEVIAAVHSYGGLVLHDVTNVVHARKAAAAGVDGLILVCAGAGGHAGAASPFALLPRVRSARREAGAPAPAAAGADAHAPGRRGSGRLRRQIREFFKGIIVLAGAISDGRAIRAAEVLGADLAYMGTRFIATQESMADPAYKEMLTNYKDGPAPTFLPTVYTDKISGAAAAAPPG